MAFSFLTGPKPDSFVARTQITLAAEHKRPVCLAQISACSAQYTRVQQ
jgi:hypothetical protein